MDEQQLENTSSRPMTKIGNTVRRPIEFWQPAVADLLKYLESKDFPYSPKFLGIDDQGREVVSYLEGESGKAGWYKIHSENGLRNYAKLLRRYHDTVAGYRPPVELEWANGRHGLNNNQLICHGDFGPWNIVWKGEEPVGIVDWDLAHPNSPQYDILYALEYAAPFRDDDMVVSWHHFESVPDRAKRVEIFLDAYGSDAMDDVAKRVARMQREVGKLEKLLADRGLQPQVEWVANGDLDEIEKRARWSEANANLFM